MTIILNAIILEDRIVDIMSNEGVQYERAGQIALHELFGEKDD